MATKQAVHDVLNAELARNTEATFGFSGDPWRQGAAYAAQSQMFNYGNMGHGKDYGSYSMALTDRYGTAGAGGEQDMRYPERPEATQRKQGMKNAEVGEYRVPIGEVVQ